MSCVFICFFFLNLKSGHMQLPIYLQLNSPVFPGLFLSCLILFLHTENAARCKYQSEARLWYQEAYDILRRHYRQCYLTPDDENLHALMTRLPELMQMHGEPVKRIDKVKFALKVSQYLPFRFSGYGFFIVQYGVHTSQCLL